MADRRLVWQLFPSYLLVTLAGIVGVSIFAAESLRESYLDQSRVDLRARAVFAASQFGQMIRRGASARGARCAATFCPAGWATSATSCRSRSA